MRLTHGRLLPIAGLAPALLVAGPVGAASGEGAAPAPATAAIAEPLADAALAGFRTELLELAFETAAAIPVRPHIKSRSRAQEAVVAACLELDQPGRALDCIERIDNWRRGGGYADLALHCARHDRPEDARRFLALAAKCARDTEDWRRDNIHVRMAAAHVWLGEIERAQELESGVVDSEAGKVAAIAAERSGEGSYREQLAALEALVALGSFDITRNAMESYTELYRRFYGDGTRRLEVEQRIKASWERLPLFVRVELLMKLARCALDHGDRGEALELVNEAQALFESAAWPLEHRIPLAARLAALRFGAGDAARAREDADAALALFDAEGEQIVNIYRARALRPLAEAYQAFGDAAAALEVYRRAVEEGVGNPNSRPRALDLSATCLSMALHGVEPDAVLRARIRRISEELGPPW
jgi:tetratricopeptide (TPR) repeat protein